MRALSVLLCWAGVLLGSSADAAGAGTRYRLVFPGYQQGQEMAFAEVRFWHGWLLDNDYDVAGFVRRSATVEVIIRDGGRLGPLTDTGFTVLEREPAQPLDDAAGGREVAAYVDPAELETFLFGEAADHPTITSLSVIGQTHENRDIFAIEISNNPGVPEDKPAFLLNGMHHAREVVTPHVVMDAITYLTDGYAAADPQIVALVDSYKIICVPMVNPDGSNRVHTVDNWHRKNMGPFCIGGDQGVDLNRNYPYHWGSGSINCERGSGSSGSECSSTYRGPIAGSEPETQAMIALAESRRPVIAVSYHSSGRFIDYPYACNDGNPDMSMPEHAVIDEIMHGTANAIFGHDGVLYDVYSPIAIGPVNGDDTSWYYAHLGAYPLIIEVATTFQPAFATGMQSVARNRPGWLYLLDRLGEARLDLRVANHLNGKPLVAEVELLDFVFDTDELPRMSYGSFGRSRWLVTANDTYTVQVSAAGYQTRSLPVAVANQPVDRTVLLLPNGTVLGDGEPDGDIDLGDFAAYQICLTEVAISDPCRRFDLTADEQVTADDFAAFAPLLTGPSP
ncbi:MAG: hypothetical protein GY778_20705 [bacterium]|nr:hypothetical protein [bacterium]